MPKSKREQICLNFPHELWQTFGDIAFVQGYTKSYLLQKIVRAEIDRSIKPKVEVRPFEQWRPT